MDPVTLIAIFLLITLLIILPYFGIIQFREKIKNQRLEARIKEINQQSNSRHASKAAQRHMNKKIESESPSNIGKILLYFFIPIPPVLFLFMGDSFYSIFLCTIVYFLFIISLYFLVKKIGKARYRKSFIIQLPNSIDQVVRNLRAGRTISDSIRTVGTDTKGPVAEQFRNISDQVELGKDFIAVVNELSQDLQIPEFSFVVIVLSVQQETGGNIIKTLSSLANMLRRRHLMRMKIKTLASEGILSAVFMGSLPFLVAGLIMLIRPEYLTVLFSTPNGQHLLIAGLVSESMGCIVIAKMVYMDV